jgi:glutathione S-transferase
VGLINDVSSFAATVVRLGRGIYPRIKAGNRHQPERLLELYDFEGCPYCRKVREALCELDLDFLVHPVAQGSPRREQLRSLGGKVQAPFLVDPNHHTALYESEDIIAYLNRVYGTGGRAGWGVPIPSLLDNLDSVLATVVRFGRGTRCRVNADRDGLKPLVLYNMEGSPYCRKVRETLSELDLAHVIRNVPKGSPKRADLVRQGGKMQVPYLIDPNTSRAMYESDDIVTYLETLYGQGVGVAKIRKATGAARKAVAEGTAPAG